MTTMNPHASLIAAELRAIVTAETLAAYVADETGSDSLDQYEPLVRAQLGGDYDPTAWPAAMDLLRAAWRAGESQSDYEA